MRKVRLRSSSATTRNAAVQVPNAISATAKNGADFSASAKNTSRNADRITKARMKAGPVMMAGMTRRAGDDHPISGFFFTSPACGERGRKNLPGFIFRSAVQSYVPRSRSRTASFQPTLSGAALECHALGRVARDAVEHGRDHLRGAQAHVLERLIDHQLLHHQLIHRHARHAGGKLFNLGIQIGGGHGFEHQTHLGRLAAVVTASPVSSMRLAFSAPRR